MVQQFLNGFFPKISVMSFQNIINIYKTLFPQVSNNFKERWQKCPETAVKNFSLSQSCPYYIQLKLQDSFNNPGGTNTLSLGQ